MKFKLVLFEKEKNTENIIKAYLSDSDDYETENVFDDYMEGFKYIRANKPKLVVFSMDKDKEQSLKIIKKISELGTNVIVLSEDFTTSNIIQILRAGAVEFVSKPILKNEFLEALNKCTQYNAKALKKSKIISVFSNKGGVGKTVVAVNLAVELARLTRDKVALVDLNMPIGDVTTFLDIKPNLHISEIINNSKGKDDNYITDACCKYKDSSLYILADTPYIEQSEPLTVKQISGLLDILRKTFPYIVIDMGTNVDKFNMSVLQNSDMILLTTIINLPLIRNCQRCLDLFDNINLAENKIKIIVNRYLDNDEITIDDVEKTLGKKVYWKVPNNYFTIMSSINKGIPVSEVNENSNITESFAGLSSKITEDLFEIDLK